MVRMGPGEAAVSVRQAAPAPILAANRLAYVDSVRASMIILVLGMHAAVTYSPFGSWYLREHPPLNLAQALFFLTFQAFLQGFFMALLFFVAGCFTPAAYDRKGPARFLADRFYRLGLPTLLFALLIGPLTEYYLAGSWRTRASFAQAMEAYVVSGRVLSGTGPLWFCVALLMFSTVYTLWRMSTSNTGPARDLSCGQVGLTVLAMAAATFLTKTMIPGGWAVFNMQLADFPSYIIMFAAGVRAGRSGWLRNMPARFANGIASMVSRRGQYRMVAVAVAWRRPLWPHCRLRCRLDLAECGGFLVGRAGLHRRQCRRTDAVPRGRGDTGQAGALRVGERVRSLRDPYARARGAHTGAASAIIRSG